MEHIDEKIREAEFFYNKIIEHYQKDEVRYYISAFLTSTRSIFFFLEKIMETKHVNQKEWFNNEENILNKNKIWKTLTKKRNLTVHHLNEKLGIHVKWNFGITSLELIMAKDDSLDDVQIIREQEKDNVIKTNEGEFKKGKGELNLYFDGLNDELKYACEKYLELNKQLAKKVKDRFNEKI